MTDQPPATDTPTSFTVAVHDRLEDGPDKGEDGTTTISDRRRRHEARLRRKRLTTDDVPNTPMFGKYTVYVMARDPITERENSAAGL